MGLHPTFHAVSAWQGIVNTSSLITSQSLQLQHPDICLFKHPLLLFSLALKPHTQTTEHMTILGNTLSGIPSILSRRWRRILETPPLPPNLGSDHAANKSRSNNSRLTSKAHARSGSGNPLQLEVCHAESSSRPTSKRQHTNNRNRPLSNSLNFTHRHIFTIAAMSAA